MIVVHQLKRKTKNGYSLYLDYTVNGKRKQERTGLALTNGTDTFTRLQNKEVMVRFKCILLERQKELMDGVASLPLAIRRQKMDFIQFFRNYMDVNPSNERRDSATLKKLIDFNGSDVLPVTSVTENYLRKFRNYLEAKLSGETPYDYFKYLKMVIKQAIKEGWFTKNPAEDIKVSRKSNAPKNFLTFEELRQLSITPCSNDIVRRAFLFSCYTGLRYCDMKELRWSSISDDNFLRIVQVKTKYPLVLPLHKKAIEFMGIRSAKNDMIFPLPSCNGTNKCLAEWVKRAGIDKHITYHCSRHSFASNLTEEGADILRTSKAMGHASIKETPRYIRLSEHQVNNVVLMMESI